jgi:hypothetical protein
MEFGSFDDGRQWCEMTKEEFDEMGVELATRWAMSFSQTSVKDYSSYSYGGNFEEDEEIVIRECAAALAFALEHQCWWLVEAVRDRLRAAENFEFLHHHYDREPSPSINKGPSS